jgi:biopolymer transport protein TolQ
MQPVNWVQLVAQQSENSTSEGTVWAILGDASGMVLAVLVLLILASIASWFLIFLKWRQIKRATSEAESFSDEFYATDRFDELSHEAEKYKSSPTAAVFTNGYEELRRVVGDDGFVDQNGLGNVERALRKSANEELNEQERYLTFLATVGSTAPFVGLFGTVWGIMTAFMDISAEGTAGLDVVAGPIAEALIATAIGLLAAIPAVMAFNFFNASVESLRMKVEGFMNDFMNVVERSLLR